ncbi:DUF3047 domain-containing protein [Hydrogenophaga aromaticivorans]|nr:DUF3047 domain-containing protein [Hydrogenophaga aromaticivorans]
MTQAPCPFQSVGARAATRAAAVCLALAGFLSGCASKGPVSAPPAETFDPPALSTPPEESAGLRRAAQRLLKTPSTQTGWTVFPMPGKTFTPFEPVHHAGREALRVQASSSVSILRQRMEPALPAVGRLSFAWTADALPPTEDVAQGRRDDAVVRVLLSFDGDRSRLSPRVHRLSEMSRLLTGEDLPYATLVYVWSDAHAPGTVLNNSRTDRVRKLVLDSGTHHLGQWRDHERDVRADFVQVFGEEPGPLLSVALMTDTDNTRSQAQAWYGALRLLPAAP